MFIYVIQNVVNMKVYIGQATTPKSRWSSHKYSAKTDLRPLYCSMRKHGIQSFTFQVIEEWQTEEETNEAEDFWIDFFQSTKREFGYNIMKGGDHSSYVHKPHSEETKMKISLAHKGKKHSPEWIANSANSRKGLSAWNKGVPRDEETKLKISQSLTGRPSSNKGFRHTDETKAKVKLARSKQVISKKLSPEQVIVIASEYALGGISQEALASKHSISKGTMWKIARGTY